MLRRTVQLLTFLCVLGVLCVVSLGAQTNPRIGTWKMKSDATPPPQNLMIYEPYGNGGMRVTDDNNYNEQGEVTSTTTAVYERIKRP